MGGSKREKEMMRCHYIYDKGEKILIPGCTGGCYIYKVEDCMCSHESFDSFERKAFNDQVQEMKKYITQLELLVENLQGELKRRSNDNI